MLVPLSWLRAVLPALGERTGRDVADALLRVGLEVERVERLGVEHLVVGEVLAFEAEPQKNGKTIRWCQVAVGEDVPRGIVCGAANFAAGDRVVVALPGAVLPGDFRIGRRKTYGHWSDGMICSARELGIGEDHDGILVLGSDAAVGIDASSLLALDDEVLDIAVTPDRGYQLSVRGVAREAAAALGLPFADPADTTIPELPAGQEVFLDDLAGCDRYVALTVDGLDPSAPTPGWLRDRLVRAGMRPVSLAVDVTNYVMLELGQPLHAFDADTLSGAIRVRRAVDGETLTTLDHVDRTLDPEDVVIADDDGPVALAGVMGGARTEIAATTTRVLIEAAHFPPTPVARAVRRHRLPSEAARRFERAVDPELCPAAALAAARLLAENGGATAVALTDVDRHLPLPALTMAADLPARVGGRPVAREAVVTALETVGCTVSGQDALVVEPPPWRPDLVEGVDLVEEVLRLEGLDLLPSVLPLPPGSGGLTAPQRRVRAVSRALAAAGYVEVVTSPFVAPGAGRDGEPELVVRNPLSAEESVLRTSLVPGLAGALARNTARGRPDVALFEVGLVFRDRRGPHVPPPKAALRPDAALLAALDASLPEQPVRAGWLLAGRAEPAGWWGPGRPVDWTDALAAAYAVGAAVGRPLAVAASPAEPYHPGRCAAVLLDGQVVGHAGQLHPDVAEALGLPPGTCGGEIDLGPLLASDDRVVPAPRPSGYPAGTVDVALVVADEVPHAAVAAALREGAGPLLEDLALFDIYAGAPVPAGSRSLAFTLRFRASDRTLDGDEVNAARDAAVAAAAAATGARLRA
ncbi:MAG TPA: phenylalanine--tRNA ligase subunit beta [Mycobacteriales bacterium]